MNDDFQLPVTYKGKELLFTSRLLQFGFTYKIEVELEDTNVHFEKDEAGEWRALLSQHDLGQNKSVDPELIGAILASIGQITA